MSNAAQSHKLSSPLNITAPFPWRPDGPNHVSSCDNHGVSPAGYLLHGPPWIPVVFTRVNTVLFFLPFLLLHKIKQFLTRQGWTKVSPKYVKKSNVKKASLGFIWRIWSPHQTSSSRQTTPWRSSGRWHKMHQM